ncbi:MAG: hypothetical protein U1U88_000161 [Lawsonella clevelandensis]
MLTVVFWPLTVLVMVHKVFIQAVNGYVTNDFAPVYTAVTKFLAGQPVYTDRLRLYQPSLPLRSLRELVVEPFWSHR